LRDKKETALFRGKRPSASSEWGIWGEGFSEKAGRKRRGKTHQLARCDHMGSEKRGGDETIIASRWVREGFRVREAMRS